jgi:hypothetical protein
VSWASGHSADFFHTRSSTCREYEDHRGVPRQQGADGRGPRRLRSALLDAFLNFQPTWDSVYGGYKPYDLADMLSWFHDLDQLPPGT